jgi:ABC-type transport system involved in multi-copper enzyme maturation permease subunit
LSDAEIVLGRLASRLVTVLGVIACSLPVLAILTLLGGFDPVDVLTSTMVIVGVSVLGVCLSLTFSVWATRPHEALMATYAAFAVWLLTLLVLTEIFRGAVPRSSVVHVTNPVWLLLATEWAPNAASASARFCFLVASLIVSAGLTLLSIWRIRAVTLRQASRPARRPASRGRAWVRRFHQFGLPLASLEHFPVLWRELYHRPPSRWGLAIWRLYGALSVLFALVSIFVNPGIAPGTSAFIVSIGLLLVSVHSATVLAEERSHGSLDVLLTTPLATRSIVVGKWWGAFRPVPKLAVLPGLIAVGVTAQRSGVVAAVFYSILTTALVLAYGAFFAGVGLAMATGQPRLGRAVGFSVGIFLIVTIIYPAFVISTTRTGPGDMLLLWISPFFGMFIPMGWICWFNSHSLGVGAVAMFFWVVLTAVAAWAIRGATVRSFDRLVGRASERSSRYSTSGGPGNRRRARENQAIASTST